jgi:hypothetical protein
MIKLFIDLNSNTFYLDKNFSTTSFEFEVHVLASLTQKVKNFGFDFYLQCPVPEIQSMLVEEDVPLLDNDGGIVNGAGIFARRKYSNLVPGNTYNFVVAATNLRVKFEKILPLSIL